MVDWLIITGANIGFANNDGDSALHIAAVEGLQIKIYEKIRKNIIIFFDYRFRSCQFDKSFSKKRCRYRCTKPFEQDTASFGRRKGFQGCD